MQHSIKSLFITSLLLSISQQAQAEWLPHAADNVLNKTLGSDNLQTVPWTSPDVTPITWGDCVPVPVNPLPVGNMPMNMRPPRPIPPPYPLAPQRPYYGAIPAPIPMPMTLPPVPQLPTLPPVPIMEAGSPATAPATPECDTSEIEASKTKLAALQAQYDQGAEASRKKIEELNLALSDTKKQLSELNATKNSLQSQLTIATEASGRQARKLLEVGKTNNDLNALKQQLATVSATKQALQEKLDLLLKQSTEQLNTLKQQQQALSTENSTLKKQLADFKTANKTLQTQLGNLKTDAASKGKEVLALKQSSSQVAALKQAYQTQNTENAALKKQLANALTANKSLQATVAPLKTEVAAKNKEIAGLKQSSPQLVSLQQANKQQQDLILNLKNQLASFAKTKTELESCKSSSAEAAKKCDAAASREAALQAELSDLKNKSGLQAQKIAALTLSTGELDKLKNAYKDLASKKEALNSKLAKVTADSDKDGILDSVDKCPESPAGSQVNSLGCPADADKDGISDSKDECPTSPLNSKVNDKGCPVIATQDKDNDGVVDTRDMCPASKAGATVNEFGCTASENITLKGVTFRTASARLTNASSPILDAAAKTLKSNPDLKIEISGHTDNQGEDSKNLRLSQVRANTVMIYLIRQGVAAQNLTAIGYGETEPVASNETAEGRAANRRVELKILK